MSRLTAVVLLASVFGSACKDTALAPKVCTPGAVECTETGMRGCSESGKSWIEVFWTPPKGNAYYNLAHQYMAAKLNGFAGASVPTEVQDAIDDAEAWFALYSPSNGFWKSNKKDVMQAAGILGSYNEGELGPGHCSEAPRPLLIMAE